MPEHTEIGQMPDAKEANSILIVDDQKRLRKGLARSLSQEDCRTLAASSGEEALRLLERTRVDLVITDLVMPGMDGMALVREMRKSALDVEVVIITAYGSAESMQEARELGVAHYLAKPFDLPNLKSKVKELLARGADGGNRRARRRSSSAHRPPAGVGLPASGRAPAEPGASCPASGRAPAEPGASCPEEDSASLRARLGGAGPPKALRTFPREALERVGPGVLVRAGGKALRMAVGVSRRIAPYVSPRNVVRGLGKAARTVAGLASAFLK
jgi:two-component system response regulator (stage 0 sporulation protein F)